MTIKEFIEKAIEGGWKEFLDFSFLYNIGNTVTLEYGKTKETVEKLLHEILLDPNAWEAVGKSLGWGDFEGKPDMQGEPMTKKDTQYFIDSQWKERQKGLITHLQDDGTTESYIKTL